LKKFMYNFFLKFLQKKFQIFFFDFSFFQKLFVLNFCISFS
jgi:hypothetical protein